MMTAHGICKYCGKEAVHLATAGVVEVVGDQDDDLDGRSIYADRGLAVEIHVGTHTCFECGEIEDAWIEYPRQDDELRARVAELKAEVAFLSHGTGHLRMLIKSLMGYRCGFGIQHKDECGIYLALTGYTCDCGFSEALVNANFLIEDGE